MIEPTHDARLSDDDVEQVRAEHSPQELAVAFLKDPCGHDNPQALLAGVRDTAPVLAAPNGVYLVSGYDEARAVYRDHEHLSSAGSISEEAANYRLAGSEGAEAQATRVMFVGMMFTNDDPDHARLRSIAREPFSVTKVKQWRPSIDRVVAELIDSVKSSASFDVVRMLGYPLSERVICEILGVPYADFERVEAAGRVVSGFPRTRPPTADEQRILIEASTGMIEYFNGLIDERRAHGTDDLISALVAANADNKVSQDEIIANLVLLVIAGHDTTANMVANGLACLLHHPIEYRKLRDDPSLVPAAVEEMLRYEPSAPCPLPRFASSETDIAGVTVPTGSSVVVANHAASRDPRHFVDPDRFDVHRYADRTATPHLGFGFGIHRCLGEHLARAELQSLFHAVVTELPELELVEQGPWHHGFFRHIDRLVVSPRADPR